MANTLEYKCPCCGGSLKFDMHSQKVTCEFCGSEFDINDIKSYNEELSKEEPENLSWDDNQTQEYTDEELAGLNVYHCESCGGEIVADENTSATTCPYCEAPVLLKGRLTGALKPDYVIPFIHDKEACKTALSNFLKKKLFLPKVFKTENKIDEIKGLYVPFWVYNADAKGRVTYKGEIVTKYTRGDYRYTERKYYSIIREGSLGFDHIPVDGSKSMPDDLMESIEPFDFSGAKPFEGVYLSGHLSDKYDVDKDECQGRATTRVKEGTIDQFATTIHGYDSWNYENCSLQLYNTSVSYCLYPVWILNSSWKNRKFTFAMNAQTGKMVGNLPCSPLKYALWFVGLYLLTAGLLSVLIALLMAGDGATFGETYPIGLLVGAALGFITPAIVCRINRKKLKPVKKQRGACNYYRANSMELWTKRDFYLYKKVTRTKISK